MLDHIEALQKAFDQCMIDIWMKSSADFELQNLTSKVHGLDSSTILKDFTYINFFHRSSFPYGSVYVGEMGDSIPQ